VRPTSATGRASRCDRGGGRAGHDLIHAHIHQVGRYLAIKLGTDSVRIQICGRLAVQVAGQRVEARLPGRQGRLLFVYLTLNRRRPVGRDQLVEALWPYQAPGNADAALRPLLSKLRAALGPGMVSAGTSPALTLPTDAYVDLEAAGEALHRAESAVADGRFTDAWGPARVALHTSERPFLLDADAPWIDDVRRDLDAMRVRALEAVAAVGIGIGGGEIAAAERAGRRLTDLAPLRETGWLWLIRALAARGNPAEALLAYDRLRLLLREELGTTPNDALKAEHAQLLART
jgi:SARP family transcriptional regulator, regulator of embCAB operon